MLASPRGRYYYYVSGVDIGFGEEWLTGSQLSCHRISRFWSKTLTFQTSLSPRIKSLPCALYLSFLPPDHSPHIHTWLFSKRSWPVGRQPKPLCPVLPTKSSPDWAPEKERRGRAELSFSRLCQLLSVSCVLSGSLFHPVFSVSRSGKPFPPFTLPNLPLLLVLRFCTVLHSACTFENGRLLILFYWSQLKCSICFLPENPDWCVPLTQFWTQLFPFQGLTVVNTYRLEQENIVY